LGNTLGGPRRAPDGKGERDGTLDGCDGAKSGAGGGGTTVSELWMTFVAAKLVDSLPVREKPVIGPKNRCHGEF
jgi:hypothetical protein